MNMFIKKLEAVVLDNLTPKGEKTRAQILDSAVRLFGAKGYNATTMREIASDVGCSLGLAYRYFPSKEELVVAMYDNTCAELREFVIGLPRETIAARYTSTIRNVFARLALYRGAFAAISSVTMDPTSQAGVLSERMGYLRRQGIDIIRVVLSGAKDAPNANDVEELTVLAYAAYLLLLLFWVQDTTPDQTATVRLMGFVEDAIGRLRPLLGLPLLIQPLKQLAGIISPVFGPAV